MMDKSKTPRHGCRSCRYLTLCRGVLDSPINTFSHSLSPSAKSLSHDFFIAAQQPFAVDVAFAQIYVPTVETVSLGALLALLVGAAHPVLLVGAMYQPCGRDQ
jgi:hypothetical protein